MISIREKFNEQFARLKSCSDPNVDKHVVAILELFPFADRASQEEFTNKINDLSWKYAVEKPKLYCYARLVRSFFLFYGEKYDEALPLLTETRNLFEEHGDKNGAALCTGVMGSIYRTMGNVSQSLIKMLESFEQLKTSE